ncbi:MAG: response regulator [Spirochaetales bacterium]|nr:response regulator [Spirochaetales bacterium]
MTEKTILVVEDDSDLQEHIRIAGKNRSYRMLSALNGLEAKKKSKKTPFPI